MKQLLKASRKLSLILLFLMSRFLLSKTLNMHVVKQQVVAAIEATKILNEFRIDIYKMNWKI